VRPFPPVRPSFVVGAVVCALGASGLLGPLVGSSAGATAPAAAPGPKAGTPSRDPRDPVARSPDGAPQAGAPADQPGPPTTGFWLVLVKPHAKWILRDTLSRTQKGGGDKIVVETYDTRAVGPARVGRLRWTYVTGHDSSALDQCGFGCPRRVAVTSAGLYFLDEDASDALILDRLKHPPDRSEPPRSYGATRKNHGRYLKFDGARACMGEEPPADTECDDTCGAEVCIAAEAGVVQLSGTWAPDSGIFAQDGYE
jgi:hypothetical protein